MQKAILYFGILFLSASQGARASAAPCVPSGPGAADYVAAPVLDEGGRPIMARLSERNGAPAR